MLVLTTLSEMTHHSLDWRRQGLEIGFVPTMGFLHEGHLRLIDAARAHNQRTVVSIYVNPTQFDRAADLASYPRNLERDLELCRRRGCDAVFVPDDRMMYPAGYATYVTVEGLADTLCGATRPGHFRGVTTIVTKLFNCVGCRRAYFGEKDYQQLAIIRRMTEDLNAPVEIIGMPTVRESDGLAMSSRNANLTPAHRLRAVCLSAALYAARDAVDNGERDVAALRSLAESIIRAGDPDRIDYLSFVDAETLASVEGPRLDAHPVQLALAVFFGAVRLIDNLRIYTPCAG